MKKFSIETTLQINRLHNYFHICHVLKTELIGRNTEHLIQHMTEYGVAGIEDVYKKTNFGIIYSLFYSSLYVLIDGWQKIEKSTLNKEDLPLDQPITDLLDSDNGEHIKKILLFRNYMYHFNIKNKHEKNWEKFVLESDALPWALTVYKEFRRFYISDVAAEFGVPEEGHGMSEIDVLALAAKLRNEEKI